MAITVTRWTAAENNFKQNLSSPSSASATSVGVGLVGADICATVDLGSGRILWLFGDTFWATAAGQTRAQSITATNGFVRNTVGVSTGYDLSTATFTWHARTNQATGNVAAFFPNYFPTDKFYKSTDLGSLTTHGPASPDTTRLPRIPPVNGQRQWGKYPMCGIKLTQAGEDRVLVVGMYHISHSSGPFNTLPSRSWAMLARNITGTPDTWEWKEVPLGADTNPLSGDFHFLSNGIVQDDNSVYIYANGPWDQTGRWAVCRYPVKAAWSGKLDDPAWLTSSGWVNASAQSSSPRLDVAPAAVVGDQTGAVHKRADGQWQITVIPTVFLSADPRVHYATRANPEGAFGALTELYDITLGTDEFAYQALAHLAPTWSGKAANDICIGYSRNTNSFVVLSDARSYQPEFLQVTGS